jgi:glycosyltransferase involved in cell wall biosynthesis
MLKKRLAIITTHPIQYNAPLFELLTQRGVIEVKVFYTWGKSVLDNKFDPGFGKVINWDIDLLKGYTYTFLQNVSTNPGSSHFNGIDNPTIINEIESWKADAVLVYGWNFKSHLKCLRYFKGKLPIYFRGDSTMLDKKKSFNSILRKIFLKWIYRHVDAAFYVGHSNFEYYKQHGLRKNQLIFAPHAIDNKRFNSNEKTKNLATHLRHSLDIRESDFIFLFAGKLESKKNPELLLEAFISASFDKNTHLVIVGNGELETLLKSKSNSRNIHFLDFQNQSNMPGVYELANTFILPSAGPGESWGLAVNEAMANGKSIIVSDKCGCAQNLVVQGLNGFVFESQNITELKKHLIKMVELSTNDNKMSAASLEIIKDFTFEKIAKAIESQLILNSLN